MRRLNTTIVYLTLGFAAASVVGWFAYSVFAMPDIQPHVGNGKFANRSWRFPWESVGIPVTGYTIEFVHFPLSRDHDATYTVEQLPDIGKEAGVYLCIHDPSHKWRTDKSRAQLIAAIEIEVVDEGGQSVCHVKQPLAKMFWAYPEGGRDTWGLYLLDDSFFEPRRKGTYQIKVHYAPDPKLSDFQGFIWLRRGGSI